jgi:hypothetical protein
MFVKDYISMLWENQLKAMKHGYVLYYVNFVHSNFVQVFMTCHAFVNRKK